MDKERGWWVVVAVALMAIAATLIAAWHSSRSTLAQLAEPERRALYESNWKNFSTSCLKVPEPAGVALNDFCRQQAEVLQRLPECDPDCRRQTSSFTTAQPSR